MQDKDMGQQPEQYLLYSRSWTLTSTQSICWLISGYGRHHWHMVLNIGTSVCFTLEILGVQRISSMADDHQHAQLA